MTREEAIKAVVRMMSAYPNFRCSQESMLTLAEVLLQFPLETAMAAASPVHGAPKKYKDFPLSAGQLTDWCQDMSGSLYQEARFERVRLAPPERPRLSQSELDAQFERLGLSYMRPGKYGLRAPRHTAEEVREANEILERYARQAHGQ